MSLLPATQAPTEAERFLLEHGERYLEAVDREAPARAMTFELPADVEDQERYRAGQELLGRLRVAVKKADEIFDPGIAEANLTHKERCRAKTSAAQPFAAAADRFDQNILTPYANAQRRRERERAEAAIAVARADAAWVFWCAAAEAEIDRQEAEAAAAPLMEEAAAAEAAGDTLLAEQLLAAATEPPPAPVAPPVAPVQLMTMLPPRSGPGGPAKIKEPPRGERTDWSATINNLRSILGEIAAGRWEPEAKVLVKLTAAVQGALDDKATEIREDNAEIMPGARCKATVVQVMARGRA